MTNPARVGLATMPPTLRALHADSTIFAVDAIVNAANASLLGGGGVDGAIDRAAGPGLLAECRLLGGCLPGEARLTTGNRLPARFIIHTVGPVWHSGHHGAARFLLSPFTDAGGCTVFCCLSSVDLSVYEKTLRGRPPREAMACAVANRCVKGAANFFEDL